MQISEAFSTEASTFLELCPTTSIQSFHVLSFNSARPPDSLGFLFLLYTRMCLQSEPDVIIGLISFIAFISGIAVLYCLLCDI